MLLRTELSGKNCNPLERLLLEFRCKGGVSVNHKNGMPKMNRASVTKFPAWLAELATSTVCGATPHGNSPLKFLILVLAFKFLQWYVMFR